MHAPRDYRLPAILLIAVLLRLALVSGGGQFFFGDEGRHERGVALYLALRAGDASGLGAALARPEHIGFTLLGAGLTGLQHLTAQLGPYRDWQRPENVTFTFPLAAAWLALFSVLNIWLVHRIARRAGADETTAVWAALLMACSNTGFYYARHFLPYDAALSCALLAVWLGLDGRRSLATGLLAGAAYHVYNGYWYLVPVVLALHALEADPGRSRLRRLCWAGAGAALARLGPILTGRVAAGPAYWQTMVAFSGTVNQGRYTEGWSLPWEYFWHSEGWFGLAVLLGLVAAWVVARRSGVPIGRQARVGLAGAVMSYAWLVLFSVGLEKFIVYARSVKPLVPFLCLAGGWAVARLLADRRRAQVGAAVCCALAAIQFAPHFAMTFPAETERRILREFGNPKHSLSVAGSLYAPLALPVQRPDLVLVNAQLLYPVRDYIGYPAGTTLVSLEHPLSYPPFQYESHNPRERALLRSHDIRLRLIQLSEPASVPADLPPALRFTAADRPDGHH